MIMPGQFARELAQRVFARLAVVGMVALAVFLVGYGVWMWLISGGTVDDAQSQAGIADTPTVACTTVGQVSFTPISVEMSVPILPSATSYPTYTPYPTLEPYATFTPYPTFTPIPTERSQSQITQFDILPTATPDYAALLQVELEQMRLDAAAERARADADAAMWRELWRWACLVGLAPVAVLLTGLVVLALSKMADGDGTMAEGEAEETEKAEEAPGPERVSLEVKTNGGKSLLWHRHPVDKRVLRQWIRVALNGGSIAIGNWAGSNKPFTRGSYEKFVDYWMTAGVLMDKYPGVENSERVLTEGGAAALQGILAKDLGYV